MYFFIKIIHILAGFLLSTLKSLTKQMKAAPSRLYPSRHAIFATWVLPALIGAMFLVTDLSAHAANLTVDGVQTFQTIDGMGVNINVNSWNNGQLKPALDFLVTTNGSTLFRVIRDPIDWLSSESLIPDLHALTPSTLQQVYETTKMQDIWNTIGYLNQKGIGGRQIILNFMGWTPTWVGGSGTYGVASYITAGKEQDFATMVASLVYYGKKVKGLDFTYLAPVNEEDLNGSCLEGPCIAPVQYTTIVHDIADELNYMGISDVRFALPDAASMGNSYISQLMSDSTVAGLTDHFALHDYSGNPVFPGTAYTGKNYWLTETSAWCSACDSGGGGPADEWSFATQTTDIVLGDINNGFSAVLIWEAYDNFWYHHNASSLWGLLAYNQATGIYTPRTRAYAYTHFNHFIGPGDVVIKSSDSINGVPTTVAVYNAITGKIAIVGRNSGNSAVTIDGQMSNLPAVNSLALYETSSSVSLSRKADVPVAGGFFTAQVSANTIFTLTNQPITFDLVPPTVAISSPLNGALVSDTIEVTANASDNNIVTGVQFVLDGASFGQESALSPYSISIDTTTLANGGHTLSAIARDPAGNETLSQQILLMVNNGGGSLPSIYLVQNATNVTTSAQYLSATLSSPVTSGNLIVVSVSGWPNLPAATPVTDSLGNSYSIAGTVLVSQGAYSAIYYARNVTGGTATVTVSTVSTGGQISMAVAEFSGVDTVSPLDKTAGSVGSGTTPSSGAMTPGMTGGLIIGSGTHNGTSITSAGSGFSMIAIPTEDSNTHQPLAMEYQILSGTAPTSAAFGLTTGYPWTMNGALFRRK